MVEVIAKMQESKDKVWSTTELSCELNRSRNAVRNALRILFGLGMIRFAKGTRKEQWFAPTEKLMEVDLSGSI